MAKTLGNYLLLGTLALFLWFAVLRPLLRKHLQHPPAVRPFAGKEETQPEGTEPQQAQAREREAQRHLENTQYAKETAATNPKMVAMLVKHWMGKK